MRDMEHEEWLENAKARKAAKKPKSPPVPPEKTEERKRDEPKHDGENIWRGEY